MLSSVVFMTCIVLEFSSALDNIGPCYRNVSTDASMDFSMFASEQDGSWHVVRAVNTSFNGALDSLSYHLMSTNDPDEYYLSMVYVTKNGETGTFAEEVMTDLGSGTAISEGSIEPEGIDYSLQISFMKYVPGRYAFYTLCSDNGTDTTVDYRYVLAHGQLSKKEEDEIKRIDRRQGFKGQIISLLVWY